VAKTGITLTQERLKDLLHYDPETGIFAWIPGKGGKGRPFRSRRAGTINPEGYQRIQIDGAIYQGSALAYLYILGSFPKGQIDHIDRNASNDAWDNLRPATQNQNKANSGTYRNNGLGVKGVRRHRNGQYEARLRFHGSLVYLGCYRTIEDAKAVYDAAAREHFGVFARSS
jgi:hypothetical protein